MSRRRASITNTTTATTDKIDSNDQKLFIHSDALAKEKTKIGNLKTSLEV
jgi:hypothetical protein